MNPYAATGQFEKLVSMARDVLDLLEKKNRTSDFFGLAWSAYATFCEFCGMAMGFLGNFPEGELFLEKGLRHALNIGDVRTLAGSEYLYGCAYWMKGDWRAAAEHLQKCIGYSEEVKYQIGLSFGWSVFGECIRPPGRPGDGENLWRKGPQDTARRRD